MFRKQSAPMLHCAGLAVLLLALGAAAGCRREAPPPPAVSVRGPDGAVLRLVQDLRQDDLAGYARHAVPPALHAQLDAAWREDRSRWPLTGLPLHARLPGMLATLAAPDAEKTLLATYHRQFAGAGGELRSAAATVSLFALQYLQREGDYSDEERDHYTQLVGALGRWGKRAPLAEARLARVAVPQLVSAARLTGLADPARYGQLGMDRSLRRLAPFFTRLKRVLRAYGLDLDAALDSVRVGVTEQVGGTARVRLRYRIAGQDIDAQVRVERIDGQWYLTDALRHARTQAAAGAVTREAAAAAGRPR